ncbi:hypothetical protein GQX74_007736 [Glossina fuscipes]|nr:hypothetical protein GQX74_007736 [Glossina fuscipes]
MMQTRKHTLLSAEIAPTLAQEQMLYIFILHIMIEPIIDLNMKIFSRVHVSRASTVTVLPPSCRPPTDGNANQITCSEAQCLRSTASGMQLGSPGHMTGAVIIRTFLTSLLPVVCMKLEVFLYNERNFVKQKFYPRSIENQYRSNEAVNETLMLAMFEGLSDFTSVYDSLR